MDDQNFKNKSPTKLDFHYIRKIHELIFVVLQVYKEKMFTIEIEDGREASWKPSNQISVIKKKLPAAPSML